MQFDPKENPNAQIADWAGYYELTVPELLGNRRYDQRAIELSTVVMGRPELFTAASHFLGKIDRRAAIYRERNSEYRLQFERLTDKSALLVQLKQDDNRPAFVVIRSDGSLPSSILAGHYGPIISKALKFGEGILHLPMLPITASEYSRFSTLVRPALASEVVNRANLSNAHALIEQIFESAADRVAASECYSAFAQRRVIMNDGGLRPEYELVDYRIFSAAGRMIGVGGLYRYPGAEQKSYFLGWLGVIASERGNGYGPALVSALEDEALRKGANWLYVHTPRDLADYESARRMYRSLGFTVEPFLTFHDDIYDDHSVELMLAKKLVALRRTGVRQIA